MTILVIVLVVISLLTTFRLIQYRQQLKNINHQLRFIQCYESNLLLTTQLSSKQFNEMIGLLNQELLKQKNRSIDFQRQEKFVKESITNLAHDIRTPLTSLDGYFQLLIKSRDMEKKEGYIAIIKNRITTLTEMLEAICTYTKLQNNDYDISLSKIQVNQILFTNLFAYFPLFSEKKIEPIIDITEEPLSIMGDEATLSRVLSNIVKNSMDHGQGEIRISLQKEFHQVMIICQNGIRPEDSLDISKLFDRFYMSELSRNGQSTGLGLVIARELVKKMNGTIELSVNQTIFSATICFPISD